jgi:hypothetical protein
VSRTAAAGEQLRQLAEGTLGLADRAHLDPVAEHHDRDQRRQLLPQRHPAEAENHGEAEAESDGDGQRDQRHHARQPVPELAHRALEEGTAAIEEHQGAEHGRDPAGSRERGRPEAERAGQHVTPDEGGDRQREADPESVAEHRDAVAGVLVARHGRRARDSDGDRRSTSAPPAYD